MKKVLIILLTFSLLLVCALAVNAAGETSQDLIQVELEKQPLYYTGAAIKPEPLVMADGSLLTKDVHYTLSYENNINAGSDAKVIITGMGEWEGVCKTISFPIYRRDISNVRISVGNAEFAGMPVTPKVDVYNGLRALVAGTDYVVYCQNNVNKGTGTCYVVGIGNYCGYATREFTIYISQKAIKIKGAFNGYATDTQLNDQIYYEEAIVPPGQTIFTIDSSRNYAAYYELHQLVGEEFVFVTSKETEYGREAFSYDFTSIYEGSQDVGGEVYMLAYSWVDGYAEVYSGAYVMLIPAKVADATSMVVEQVEGIADPRRVYLCAYGPDGNVGKAVWTSSNSAVATVDGGVVTFHRPGKVTITAQYGDLVASKELVMTTQDLTQCQLVNYDLLSTSAQVYHDGYLLEEGTDYDISMSQQGDTITFTATGRGLFTGQIVREFGADGEPLGHTHTFDRSCDDTCNGCDYTRSVTHQFADTWKKNLTHHYHACTVCGQKEDLQQHILSAEDETICTICGLLKLPGDCNGDLQVNNEDVIHLLWYTMFPESYPLEADGDVNGDGHINNEDVIHLLWHTMFPDNYPIA